MPEVVVIDLWPPEQECIVCGALGDWQQGLAMYEGEIVPDDHGGDWAGFPACPPCFERNVGHVGRPLFSGNSAE